MFDNYEKFKKDVYALTKIDLNYYNCDKAWLQQL